MFLDIFTSICLLLAGIAVFLLGIKLMSNGLDRGAGRSIKKMFVRVGDNRFANAGIGAGATATIQSSTAVTVMVVGFANAGVITLLQSTAMIMGANVGTTLTAFFAVVDNLPISPFFMMTGIVGISMFMFSKNHKVKIAGEIILGLSLIFVGMFLMGRAFPRYVPATYTNPNPTNHPFTIAFRDLFIALSANPVGPLLLVLIGAIFTAIIQSSTAATNMAVIMASAGVLPLEAGIFIILGANVGTTLTALLASIGTSTNAKRAAITHLMYNLFGIVIFLPLLWILRVQTADFLMVISTSLFSENPVAFAAAFFHLFYNLALFGLLIGFTRPFTAMITKMVPAKEGEELDAVRLHFIDDKAPQPILESNNFNTVIEPIKKEIHHMAGLSLENFMSALSTTFVPDLSKKNKIITVEQKINFINKGIGNYLIKLTKTPSEGSEKVNKKLLKLHNVISDVERIGDQAMTILDEATEMVEHNIKFSAAAIEELKDISSLVLDLFPIVLEIFETKDKSKLSEVSDYSKLISEKKRELGFNHISRLNEGLCSVENGIHFYAVIASIDTIKDHLTNIAYSIKSPAGAQLERLKRQAKENVKQRDARKKVYW